jgi:hypothetical protein
VNGYSRLRGQKAGVALLLALGLLGVLWFVVLGFSNASVRSVRQARHVVEVEQAQWSAEAGLRLAVQALLKDTTYTPPTAWTSMAHGAETYQVVLYKEAKSPVPIPADCVYLVCTGKTKTGTSRKMAVVVKLGTKATAQSLLNFSVFANDLSLSGGCRIDSFDSTVGASIRGSLANVATNSVLAGAISLAGGSWIQGTIQVGVGGQTGTARPSRPTTKTANVVWKDWSCWSLDESAMTSALEFPRVAAPTAGTKDVNVNWAGAEVKAGSYRDLTASGGGEVKLPGGTYVFRSLKLTGGAKLSFKGTASTPAIVYITETLDLSGGTLYNTTLAPKNVTFMLAKDVTAKMTGGAQAFAVVYGPEADFTLQGGTDLYGAIVGRTVTLNSGASIHYDTNLSKSPPSVLTTTSTTSSSTTVLSWQRL